MARGEPGRLASRLRRLARGGGDRGAGGTQRIDVWATDRGYRPGVVTARAGMPTEIVFHLMGAPGCTRMLTINGRDVALPATVRLASATSRIVALRLFDGDVRGLHHLPLSVPLMSVMSVPLMSIPPSPLSVPSVPSNESSPSAPEDRSR